MTTTTSASSGGSFGIPSLLAVLLGGAILGYGLLVLPVSLLGGAWIAAIGLALLLSGLFATEWAGDRIGLSAADRRTLSLTFAIIALVLLVAFVVVNFASFEAFESGGSEQGV